MLENAKKTPMIIVHGDRDGIPLSLTQSWADKMKELEMTYEYDVLPGVDHGGVITAGAEAIVKFFTAHSKADSSDADAAAEGKSSEPAEWPAP
jgi:predicted esterase